MTLKALNTKAVQRRSVLGLYEMSTVVDTVKAEKECKDVTFSIPSKLIIRTSY